jgi:hypothetical protein
MTTHISVRISLVSFVAFRGIAVLIELEIQFI